MANCCGAGSGSKLAIGLSAGTPTRMDFIDVHSTKVFKTLSDGSSKTIRGTLDPVDVNVAEGMLFVQFRTKLWLTAAKMAVLLPCLGFTNTSGNDWTLGDSLPASKIIVGPSGSPEVTYDGAVPTDVTWEGRKGSDPIMMDIGWIAKTRATANAGTFFVSQTSPAMTEGYVYPYPDGAYNVTRLEVEGADRLFPLFRLRLDYGVISEFNQSVTATNLCPTKHDLTFGASALYSTCDSSTDLLSVPMSGDVTGASLTIDLERLVGVTTYETIFNVANMKLLAQDPNIVKNDFIRLPINGKGYATDSTAMLIITNVAS